MEFQLWSTGIANRGMVYRLARCVDWYFGLGALCVADGYVRGPASCIKPSFGPQALHTGVHYLSHHLQRLRPTTITTVSHRRRSFLRYVVPSADLPEGSWSGWSGTHSLKSSLSAFEAESSQDVAQLPIHSPPPAKPPHFFVQLCYYIPRS